MTSPDQPITGLFVSELLIDYPGWTRQYSLSIDPGERLAIQGESGLGKSSLLLAIAGLIKIKSGSVHWNGEAIDKLAPEHRPIAMLFQNDNLFEHLSVYKNMGLGLDPSLDHDRAIKDAAEQLGIASELDKKPPQLSGGQRQRVGLLRTILRPEPIVLLDEPFAELDSSSRRIAANWTLERLKETNKTLLMVTHQEEDVDLLATQRLHLSKEDR